MQTHNLIRKNPRGNAANSPSYIAVLAGVCLLGTLAPHVASAGLDGNSARVLPPQSHAYGRSYGQWSEAWFLWCFSLPTTHNPIFDTADIGTGQSGPVWFISGNFTGTPVVRQGTVPAGTALFFPIVNFWADNTDCSNGQIISDGNSVDVLRQILKGNVDQARNLSCTVDGVAVSGLTDGIHTPFRAQSSSPEGFSYQLPAHDNLLNFLGASCWTGSTDEPLQVSAAVYHPVADGIYIMLSPLTPGNHTIHCSGQIGTFVEDFTYHITVS
ncbi:MAG: hypothetical protein JWM16_6261, partial [Verrucomicrobiales bacterium]|nr:hypothetical protein [Verrucomicrobiales bacterium]